MTTITQRIFNFADESAEEIREQVSNKIGLLSSKHDGDINDMKKFLKDKCEETKTTALEKFKQHLVNNIDDLKLDLRKYVDDKHKVVLRVLRQETTEKIQNEIQDRLQVPGLVGDNCPFSTIANFLQ